MSWKQRLSFESSIILDCHLVILWASGANHSNIPAIIWSIEILQTLHNFTVLNFRGTGFWLFLFAFFGLYVLYGFDYLLFDLRRYLMVMYKLCFILKCREICSYIWKLRSFYLFIKKKQREGAWNKNTSAKSQMEQKEMILCMDNKIRLIRYRSKLRPSSANKL